MKIVRENYLAHLFLRCEPLGSTKINDLNLIPFGANNILWLKCQT